MKISKEDFRALIDSGDWQVSRILSGNSRFPPGRYYILRGREAGSFPLLVHFFDTGVGDDPDTYGLYESVRDFRILFGIPYRFI